MSARAARVEVFRQLFRWVAEEMGVTLIRAARSVNIKERRDCSCAWFLGDGRLVAQAEHIPVHLGSMPLSVAAALRAVPDPAPGDVIVLNDPFEGGTHLPDVTMVRPVFFGGRARHVVACRAHFSDIGGASPGSMAIATELIQEGLVIPPVRWSREVERMLLANVRNPRQAVGDLAAMRAALARGERRIQELVSRYGADEIDGRVAETLDYGEALMRAAIRRIPPGRYRFEDALDDDGAGTGPIPIRVEVAVEGDGAVVDFAGSAPQVAGNVNAVYAVTVSAVLYCFRCLLAEDAPTNAGNLRPIVVRAPEGTVVNARRPAAVAAGNVETSQRIVDVVLGALAQALPDRIPAASYGTMTNVSFGNERFGYYETVAGGMGARPKADGASAVQMHMTNTRNTPIEALEHELPVRVTAYTIRRGSGGAGRRRGGDGAVREFEFLEPMEVAVLSDRRVGRPYGLAGGEPGAAGRNEVVRGGRRELMPGKFRARLGAGERLRVETPGGGGWGPPGG